MADMTGRVAIAGHRSFIARALERQLGGHGKSVAIIAKANLGIEDMSCYDCVYLVLGRARPTPEEELAEREQLGGFLGNPRPPRRAVYLSSMRQTDSKRWCEAQIKERSPRRGSPVFVLRPAAVFGPEQDPDSEMLIPSMAREGRDFVPSHPGRLTQFISVDDLAGHLAQFSDPEWIDYNWCGDPGSIFDIPGTFTATPHQVHELFRAFEGLRGARERRLRVSEAARGSAA